MPLRSTRALPLAVSALIGGVVWASTESAERQTMPLAQATQTAATIGIRIHFSSCMIAKNLPRTRFLVDAGFRKRSCSNNKLKQNVESNLHHFAAVLHAKINQRASSHPA